MKLKVSQEGIVIPKELLGECEEVEITQEGNKLIITTVNQRKQYSIWDLGKNPVECDVSDGAINHDKYLYDNK